MTEQRGAGGSKCTNGYRLLAAQKIFRESAVAVIDNLIVLCAIFPNGASFSSIKLVMQPLQLPNAKHSQMERCVYFH